MKKPLKIAVDVDGTLISSKPPYTGWYSQNAQVPIPRKDVLDKIREHCLAGDEVWIWSGGGKEYAESIARHIDLENMKGIKIAGYMSKVWNDGSFDIAYDDEIVNLAQKNIQI
jgi:hypothetical protein